MRHQISAHANKPALSGTTDHTLRLYSLAAAAASVSALALAQPAEAEIVITNKTIPIHAGTPVMLDLNGDGIKDFEFSLSNYSYKIFSNNKLYVQGLTAGNGIVGRGQAASAMLRGAKIGPGGPFIHSYYRVVTEVSHLCTQSCGLKSGYSFDQSLYGKWGGGQPNRFVGVKFKINGETHYGWVRLTITVKKKGSGKGPKGSFSGTITEYGYESVANKSCGAGLPGASAAPSDTAHNSGVPQQKDFLKTGPSLGMLAAGSEGMPLWRREETSVGQ